MIDDRSASRSERALDDSFERYLQDEGKGRGGDGGTYRRNAARELERSSRRRPADCLLSPMTRRPARIRRPATSGRSATNRADARPGLLTPVLANRLCAPSASQGGTVAGPSGPVSVSSSP
ncbi:hypothetical protein NJ7G_1035 [Natrinema sp. J7-2]|nr:hypothetical protein NJ7G_1035 [Natrinema sp. J7-2]